MDKFDDPIQCPECGLFYYDDPEEIIAHNKWHEKLVDGIRFKDVDALNCIYRCYAFIISFVDINSSQYKIKKLIQDLSFVANRCIKVERQLFTYHPYILNQDSPNLNECYYLIHNSDFVFGFLSIQKRICRLKGLIEKNKIINHNEPLQARWTISMIWVSNSNRGKGYGKKLITESANHLGIILGDFGWHCPFSDSGHKLVQGLDIDNIYLYRSN